MLAPRPLPERRLPVLAGASIVTVLLPVFLIAGWPLGAWGLGAALWAGSQLLGLLFARAGIGEPSLRGSGLVAFGMMARGIAVMLVVIGVAVADPVLGLAAALVYAASYTTELVFSLALYFGGGARQ